MTKPIIAYQRPFQVWQYTVSLGQLLLRSVKSDTHRTQVDVLFMNVTGMNLPTYLQGLEVQYGDITEAPDFRLSSGSYDLGKNKLYKLSGDGWSGAVLATVMAWVDDQSDYDQPSKLMSGYWKGPTG